MKSKTLISIIMPVKNTALYLEACLDSILQQSVQHWELVAVNDHSTDNSLHILSSYAEKHSNIRVLNNTGKGIIPALRLAYQSSKGTFITRMDSDDIMQPNKLEVMQKALLKSGTGHVASGKVKYFADFPIGDGFKKYEAWLNELIHEGNNFQDIYKECVIPSPCWMAYRSDINLCGGFTPNDYPEDYDLVFRFYENQLQCLPCEQVLHQWRDYSNRTSRVDDHYADHSFLDIKLKYFLKLDHRTNSTILLWGAGKKGKRLASILTKKEIPFQWICDNPNKIGKEIYGHLLHDVKEVSNFANFQSIVSVANPAAKEAIKKSFMNEKLVNNLDYFFFC